MSRKLCIEINPPAESRYMVPFGELLGDNGTRSSLSPRDININAHHHILGESKFVSAVKTK